MSAKHKRPFYVFAAVAAVCCMVLFSGVRGSKAEDGQSPVIAGTQLTDPGHTLTPSPDSSDSSSSGSDSGSEVTGRPDHSWEGGFDITSPSLDELLTGADGEDAESVLPPFDLPPPPAVDPGDVTVPPVTDDSDGKGRGERGGKKDKDKDKDEQGDEAEAEQEAEEEAEEEVDPDVYELPEGNEGDNEGDQADEPVDPQVTP